MSLFKSVAVGVTAMTVISLGASPAYALRMDRRNAMQGCGNLVSTAHPDAKGKQRGAEIRKCKSDPDAYNKAAGF